MIGRLRAARLALTGHLALARYNLTIETRRAHDGALVARQEHHNLVTTAGLNLIRDLLNGSGSAGITHFGVGTGTATPALTDTALGAQVIRQAVTGTTTAAAQLTVSYYLSSTTANGSTIGEVGLFNAAAAGTMYARALVSPTIAKDATVTVTFTWVLTWS